jgi:acyl-CoA synthetase (AMP-forming)/AMP-acid ligase II
MPVEVIKKAIRDIGDVFVQVYGLTETYILTLLPKEDHVVEGPEDVVRRLRSCGKTLPGCLVRIVDALGQDVVAGETGEIVAAGDTVTSGYWNMPEETAQAIEDGWFYTGDLASIDEDGYIYIVDRKKEIIISRGENISPREVEEVIYSHPAVLETAVIGVPDEKWGEAVKAVIVCREGLETTADEIITLCKQNLAGFKVPKYVEFTDSLPKTASGKIARKELKNTFHS